MSDDLDLTTLDGAFAAADHLDVPDGWYTVTVETVALRRTRCTGRPMLCWTLRIVSPPALAERRLWRHLVLSRDHLGWLKQDLHLCGVDLPRLSALPDYLALLRGVHLEVTKRTRDDYPVVHFHRRVPAT